jgi:hypothetical protein
MTRKPLAAALALGMSLATAAHANEGMWMPTQLPDLAGTLKDAGFKGNPAELADVTAPPLSAVVRVGGGTGSFVSGDGLLLTNHHVAYGVIQYNASKEHNIIDEGFIAQGRADERAANPDYRVLVTVGFDKVTDDVLKDRPRLLRCGGKCAQAHRRRLRGRRRRALLGGQHVLRQRLLPHPPAGADRHPPGLCAAARDRQLRRRDRQLHVAAPHR